MPNYYPKAGRCRACLKQHANCSSLPFDTMPVHRRDGQDVSVICTQHTPASKDESPKQAKPAGPSLLELARQARELAGLEGRSKFIGHECERCRTSERYTSTGRCVACAIRIATPQRRAEVIA